MHAIKTRPAVFLDRDGVINKALVKAGKPYPPPHVMAMEILPLVDEALCALHHAHFLLIVITNQPDVAKGLITRATVETIHQSLQKTFPLDAIYTCFHQDLDHCSCRKPLPGAILQAAQDHHLDLKKSYMIGDRWKDVEAGHRAGCRTMFIDYGYQEKQPETVDFRVRSLYEAAHIILGEKL